MVQTSQEVVARETAKSDEGVVLLHGMARTSASMRVMARCLGQKGFATLNLDYDSRHGKLENLARAIHPAVSEFADGLSGQMHLVTHSMGGLLARVYLAYRRPPRLGRVLMLGPPNDGSPIADLLHQSLAYRVIFGPAGQQLTTAHASSLKEACGPVDYQLGIIAGTRSPNLLTSTLGLQEANDGKVTVRSTRLDGMADHLELPVTHTFMMRDPAVVAATIAFLREGHFR